MLRKTSSINFYLIFLFYAAVCCVHNESIKGRSRCYYLNKLARDMNSALFAFRTVGKKIGTMNLNGWYRLYIMCVSYFVTIIVGFCTCTVLTVRNNQFGDVHLIIAKQFFCAFFIILKAFKLLLARSPQNFS